MPEVSSTAMGGALLAKLFPGVAGALIIAAFDPPPSKRALFVQTAVAGVGSLVFGGPLVRILDYYAPWVDLANLDPITAFEWAAPIYLLVGALSWGVFGAIAKLRTIIRDRGADVVARHANLKE